MHPLPALFVGEDADAFVTFPAERFDGANGIEQRPHALGIGDDPAHLRPACGNPLACAAQFVARVARDFLAVAVAEQVHRGAATEAVFQCRTAPAPLREQGVGCRVDRQFVELQQGMGQAPANVPKGLACRRCL
ncbi:hypothetical protein D9M73_215320 [compost metagenome]